MSRQLAPLLEEGPPGFYYVPEFITPSEERKLIAFFQDLEWNEVLVHGVTVKRKVLQFGFSSQSVSDRILQVHRPPQELHFLLRRAALSLNIEPEEIAEILVTYFPVKAQMGWHIEGPAFENLLGVSISGECLLKMREKTSKAEYNFMLEPRSAYIMSGKSRWNWQHHIPPVKSDRYSIIFRTHAKI